MSSWKQRSFAARLRFALQGLAHALANERSFRVQLLLGAAALGALLVLRPAPIWWALVLLASAAVLAAELFNSAIEALADAVHPEKSEGIRIAKDCAAGAVLIAALGALAVAFALLAQLLSRP